VVKIMYDGLLHHGLSPVSSTTTTSTTTTTIIIIIIVG